MSITFRCADCTQKLRIEDAFAGKRVACVRCGSKQRVPKTSSPEFSQAAATPRQPLRPAAPIRPPTAQEKPRKESRRIEPEAPNPARPRPEPIWFKPVEPDEIEPPTFDLDPDQPDIILPEEGQFPPGPPLPETFQPELFRRQPVASEPPEPEPIESEPAVSDPDGSAPADSAPADSEWAEPLPTLPAATVAQQAPQDEFRPLPPEASPRARRAASKPHAESSLVPPYQKLDVEELIDMTAMVDIVFFLLIFFLVTSMHALDSTIPMPTPDPQKGAAREPRSVAAIDSDDSYIVVRVDRNDKISVEGSEVRTDRDLLFKLRDLRMSAAHPEKLLVVGHGDATHGTVVMVLDTGRELGLDQVRLTVQDEAD